MTRNNNQGAGNLHSVLPPSLRPSTLLRPLASLLLSSFLLSPVAALAAYSYSDDGSEVIDSTTGLIWRRCAEGMAWNGSACTGIAAFYAHEAALQRASSEALASGKAWRVPNVIELSSITKLGELVNPSIDTTAFPQTPAEFFWSSTPFAAFSGTAGMVSFYDGVVDAPVEGEGFRFKAIRLRLVR